MRLQTLFLFIYNLRNSTGKVKKNSISREEATSAKAGFLAGPLILEFRNVGCCGGRKTVKPGEKPSEQGENQQQRATSVGGECCHHCAISAAPQVHLPGSILIICEWRV